MKNAETYPKGSNAAKERRANILIVGTPGSGKSETARQVAEANNMRHVNAGEVAIDGGAAEDYDEDLECHIVNDQKLADALKPIAKEGGVAFEHHSPAVLSEEDVELVCVMRCGNEALHGRLKARGYNQDKVDENIQCEIFDVVSEEAREFFPGEKIRHLHSKSIETLQPNASFICDFVRTLQRNSGEHA